MGRYRRVDSRIWIDAKFRALSDDAKLVFFRLLTDSGTTSFGALVVDFMGMASRSGWVPDRYRRGIKELTEAGMAKGDEGAGLIVIPNYLKYNMPDNINVVLSWRLLWDTIPECPLRNWLYSHVTNEIRASNKNRSKPFPDPFPEPTGNGMGYPSGTVPDTYVDPPSPDALVPSPDALGDASHPLSTSKKKLTVRPKELLSESELEVFVAWNALPDGFPRCRELGPNRRRMLKVRLSEAAWVEDWKAAMDKLATLPGMRGGFGASFVAGLEWFLRPESVRRLTEGACDTWFTGDTVPRQADGGRLVADLR
jgi:hypothetical protein